MGRCAGLQRLKLGFVLLAWFLATGSQWELLQTYAWARMFVGYAGTNSVAKAVELTLAPENACPLCHIVEKAREEEPAREQSAPEAAPAAPKAKIILICQVPPRIHFSITPERWRPASVRLPESWAATPPTPPPRSCV